MSKMPPKRTSIIVVAWNNGHFLKDCFRAVEEAGIPDGTARLIIVDNASTDGTKKIIREKLLSEDGKTTKGGFPVLFIDNDKNLGFSGGNNQAMRIAIEEGDDYVYLLNCDTEAQPGFLEKAIETFEGEEGVGIVQSQLRLHPDTDRLNSWGNAIHYLGFGYAGGESVRVESAKAKEMLRVREIAYASGAGMLASTAVLKEIGLLDEELFAYHEDLEFSWRAWLAGYRVMLAPESIVHHKYEFSRSIKKYYWMERNRFIVMLRYYRSATLLLLFPAFLAMEIGLWLFAFKGGWWKEKLRAYAYFLLPTTWIKLARARRRTQALRVVTDREVTKRFVGEVLFQQMSPILLTHVANPLFAFYWRIAHAIMIW